MTNREQEQINRHGKIAFRKRVVEEKEAEEQIERAREAMDDLWGGEND